MYRVVEFEANGKLFNAELNILSSGIIISSIHYDQDSLPVRREDITTEMKLELMRITGTQVN